MKKIIVIALIYLIGCVVSYNYVKFNLTQDHPEKEWTKGDRAFSIGMSCGSWLTLIPMGIVHGIREVHNNDEKADW